MKKLSKLVSLMLSVVLCVGMAAPALAVEYDISLGDVTVTESGSWQKGHETYTESNMSTDKDITITQTNNETATSNTITVGENVTDTTITLQDVNIDVSKDKKAALSITGKTSDVTIDLEGENILKSGGNHAGLELNDGASVAIDGAGTLTAEGGRNGAGIGSGYEGTAGNITIAVEGSASVTAIGGMYGAGIGAGGYGKVNDIIITAIGTAQVTGDSGSCAAGIGGGEAGYLGSSVNNITVKASDHARVAACGGGDSAGIGTGSGAGSENRGNNKVNNITVEALGNANVTATGFFRGAGIGTGDGGTVNNVTVVAADNATIDAKCSVGGSPSYATSGAGIGSGLFGIANDVMVIAIGDAKITATAEASTKGKVNGAGIGTGGYGKTGDIIIITEDADKNLTAKGKTDIGGGDHNKGVGTIAQLDIDPPDEKRVTPNEDGTFTIPEESTVKRDKNTTTYPNGAIVDQNGNIISTDVKKNDNGTVTVITTTEKLDGTTEKRAETTVYVPEDIKSTPESNTTLPKDSTITGKDDDDNKSVITYPNGAEIDKDGNVTGDGVVKTEKDDTVEVKGADLDYTVRPPESSEDKLEVKTDGSVDIPNGGVLDDVRSETTYPDGGRVNPDGTITGEGATVSKDKDTGDVTIKNSDGETITIDVPEEKKDEVKVDEQGTTTVPEGGKVTDKDGKEIDLPFGGEVDKEGNVTAYPDPNPPTNPPVNPPATDDPEFDVPMGDGSGADAATIADQEVPLAGLTPVAQLLEELRQHENVEDVELPEDFKWLDHEYAQAIYWGLQEELVVDAEETPFDPDEVITVAILRNVLTNFVAYKGSDFVVTVEGEDDEIVFDLGERLTAFYGDLEAYLKAQKTKAA